MSKCMLAFCCVAAARANRSCAGLDNAPVVLSPHASMCFHQMGVPDQGSVVSLNINGHPHDPFFEPSESNTGSTDLFSDDTEAEKHKSAGAAGADVGSEAEERDIVRAVSWPVEPF